MKISMIAGRVGGPVKVLSLVGTQPGESRWQGQGRKPTLTPVPLFRDAASAKRRNRTGTRVVYLMRGLPSCGKSRTAKRLAGDAGIVCETDAYYHTQVGDDPARFDYDARLMWNAKLWNMRNFRRAVREGISPIVVDRGNAMSRDTQRYARFASACGYDVQIVEPESPWWQELRVLLKHKKHTGPILDVWAKKLAKMNRSTHRVPAREIRRRMSKWKHDLTVQDILSYRSGSASGQSSKTDDSGALDVMHSITSSALS